ncbi:MAG TPA: DUF4136 domain-containing protein [Pedobacter sp.]|jgi:hypothetical protein
MRKIVFPLMLSALILSACSSYNFYTVSNHKVEISKYQTYAWVPSGESKTSNYYENDIAEDRIVDAVNTELNARGFRVNNRKPDLLIKYTAVVDNKSRVIRDPVYYQAPARYVPRMGYYQGRQVYYYQYYRPFPIYAGTETRKVEFEEGNIVIDLIDRNSSKVIWRGVAKGEVNNPEKAVKDIPKVVGKIFNRLSAN